MNRGTCDLANFLDLRATLADQGTALRGRYDQSERYGRPRDSTASGTATLNIMELRAPFLKFLAYQSECLEDRVRWSSDGHYPFRAGTIGDVDLRTRLDCAKENILFSVEDIFPSFCVIRSAIGVLALVQRKYPFIIITIGVQFKRFIGDIFIRDVCVCV